MRTDNMMLTMVRWYTVPLALIFAQAVAQSCPGFVLTDYMACVAQNPCECSACDPDPTDMIPVITAERPSDCLDVARTFCPLIRCCSICEAEALAWNQCSANGFANNYIGMDCPLDDSCDAYPLQDVDCSPTMAPVETSSPTATRTSFPTLAPVLFTGSPTMASAVTNGRGSEGEPTLAPSVFEDTDSMPSGVRAPFGPLEFSGIVMVTTLLWCR
jgi:hypothetical protein